MMVWSVHFVRNVGRLKGKVSWLMKMRLSVIASNGYGIQTTKRKL